MAGSHGTRCTWASHSAQTVINFGSESPSSPPARQASDELRKLRQNRGVSGLRLARRTHRSARCRDDSAGDPKELRTGSRGQQKRAEKGNNRIFSDDPRREWSRGEQKKSTCIFMICGV